MLILFKNIVWASQLCQMHCTPGNVAQKHLGDPEVSPSWFELQRERARSLTRTPQLQHDSPSSEVRSPSCPTRFPWAHLSRASRRVYSPLPPRVPAATDRSGPSAPPPTATTAGRGPSRGATRGKRRGTGTRLTSPWGRPGASRSRRWPPGRRTSWLRPTCRREHAGFMQCTTHGLVESDYRTFQLFSSWTQLNWNVFKNELLNYERCKKIKDYSNSSVNGLKWLLCI